MVRSFSKVVFLVHPFFSIYRYGTKPLPQVRQSVKFMLGRWGNEIKRAAEDRDCLVIVATPTKPKEGYVGSGRNIKLVKFPKVTWPDKSLFDFIHFANGLLGERLIVLKGGFNAFYRRDPLKEALEKRGFSISKEFFKGRSFGEFWLACVARQTEDLASSVGVPEKSTEQVRELSIVADEKGFGANLRKNMAKLRRNKKILA